MRRVLIVDDDEDSLDALGRAVAIEGVAVTTHNSFEAARRALRDEAFDAMLTDVRLGAFNGLQLAVVARDLFPDMQIIVFSGFDDPVLRNEAEHIQATYLVKPVTADELLQLLAPQASR